MAYATELCRGAIHLVFLPERPTHRVGGIGLWVLQICLVLFQSAELSIALAISCTPHPIVKVWWFCRCQSVSELYRKHFPTLSLCIECLATRESECLSSLRCGTEQRLSGI